MKKHQSFILLIVLLSGLVGAEICPLAALSSRPGKPGIPVAFNAVDGYSENVSLYTEKKEFFVNETVSVGAVKTVVSMGKNYSLPIRGLRITIKNLNTNRSYTGETSRDGIINYLATEVGSYTVRGGDGKTAFFVKKHRKNKNKGYLEVSVQDLGAYKNNSEIGVIVYVKNKKGDAVSGVRLTINNELKGETDGRGMLEVRNLTTEELAIEASKEGYATLNQNFNITRFLPEEKSRDDSYARKPVTKPSEQNGNSLLPVLVGLIIIGILIVVFLLYRYTSTQDRFRWS